MTYINQRENGMYLPCQPIGCDNGYHLEGCVYIDPDDPVHQNVYRIDIHSGGLHGTGPAASYVFSANGRITRIQLFNINGGQRSTLLDVPLQTPWDAATQALPLLIRDLGREDAKPQERPEHPDKVTGPNGIINTPHFNDHGGCQCINPCCVLLAMEENLNTNSVTLINRCICLSCNEECPSEGRLTRLTIQRSRVK